MYLVRAVTGLIAMYLWFYALIITDLTIAISLSFVAPILTAILAAIIFKEKYHWDRWIILAIGFCGTLIILQPGTDAFNPKNFYALTSALMWAISSMIIKSLATTDSPTKIALYMVVFMTPISLPFALYDCQPIPVHMWGWVLFLGIIANFFQITLAKAISGAPFHIILPIDFTRLIFVAIFGYMFFGEIIALPTIIGSIIIMVSAVYSTYKDAKTHHKIHASPPQQVD